MVRIYIASVQPELPGPFNCLDIHYSNPIWHGTGQSNQSLLSSLVKIMFFFRFFKKKKNHVLPPGLTQTRFVPLLSPFYITPSSATLTISPLLRSLLHSPSSTHVAVQFLPSDFAIHSDQFLEKKLERNLKAARKSYEMENVDGNGGSRLMVTELSHIKELVKQLDEYLGGSPDLCKRLASQIISVTERSISMINSGHLKRSAGGAGLDSPPLSATPSPLSNVSNMPFRANKKRKMMEKPKRQIRVSSAGGGAETPVDDGHSWRKYGQKDILGAKHPRAYYRCTYRHSQGCTATKQVQRADEDQTLFDVIYHGTHTCVDKAVTTAAAAAGQAAAAKAQPEQNPDAHILLQSLSASLTVKTEGLAAEPQGWSATPFRFTSPVSGLAPPEHHPFSTPETPETCFGQGVSLSPSLELSPTTSDSNHHLSMAPFHAGWRAQSEFDEVVSALVAAASTPVPAMETDFSVDGFEFDPSFTRFDVSSFFA